MDDDEPSEMDESEEEIEEIVTEGARGLPAADPASDPTAVAVPSSSRTGAAASLNKVDHHHVTQQIVDGRAVTGMYQVVHRVETISTTTLPVVSDHAEKQVSCVSQIRFAMRWYGTYGCLKELDRLSDSNHFFLSGTQCI